MPPVRVRLAHVPKDDPAAARTTAAVLGRRFDFDTLLDVTREARAQLFDAVGARQAPFAAQRSPRGGVYDFSHDKLREVVYRDIGGARRRQLHRSVAEALERLGEDATHERDAQLAEHLRARARLAEGAPLPDLAGEHSQALVAMRDALHWLDRAVALSDRTQVAGRAATPRDLRAARGGARTKPDRRKAPSPTCAVSSRRCAPAANAKKTRDALIQLGMAYRRADQYEAATACLTEALAGRVR